jgi:DNA-binding MarR family transcriptional regulator
MKEHLEILEIAAEKKLPEQIDESSELPVQIFSELIDAGYLKAIDASSYDGTAYLHVKITLQGREYLNELKSHKEDQEKMTESRIRLFISHSSKDSLFVQAVIDLLRAALNLGSSQIRCTSIDGYRLPGGANTNEQLKQEVHQADAFIGVISSESIKSIYVVFELGARWGANRLLIPLIPPGTNTDILGGPLAGINALSSNRAQLHQLISDLSHELGLTPEPPASYERHIDIIINLKGTSLKETSTNGDQTPEKIGKNQDETVILVIWKMDDSEYDEHGYSLEAIAQRSNISIPKCQLILNLLIKKEYIELKRWMGGISGDRYLLKDAGRSYLVQNGLVD